MGAEALWCYIDKIRSKLQLKVERCREGMNPDQRCIRLNSNKRECIEARDLEEEKGAAIRRSLIGLGVLCAL